MTRPGGTSSPTPTPWTTAFTRSSIGTNLFAVRVGWRDRILTVARQAPSHEYKFQNTLFDYLGHDVAFADGGLIYRDHPNIALGEALEGAWVIGSRTMRLLAHRLGLAPPRRRLREESLRPPTDSELQQWWEAHQSVDPSLAERLTDMMPIRTSSDLRHLALALLSTG